MKKEKSLPNPHAKELRTKKYRPKVIQNKKKKVERMKLLEILERFR